MGLQDDPFTWQATQDGRILVFRGGRQVAVVAGAEATRLLRRLETTSEAAQQALARATGNYRRGNERRGSRRR
jgi:hypothetical protein